VRVIPLANVLLDGDGGIRQWDARARRLFGFAGEVALGRHCSLLYGGVDRRITALLAEAAEVYCADYEGECVRQDGSSFPARTLVTALRGDGDLRGYSLVVQDLAEQSVALPRLRELHRATLHAGEAERTCIARALHDEVGERLTALRMDLAWLARRVPAGDEQLTERTGKMKQLVDATVASVRRIATDLRPAELDNLGLVPAVEHLLHELSKRTGIGVSIDASLNSAEFGEPLVTAVYRILQEAVAHITRRADATEVCVALQLVGDKLRIGVRDNGRVIGPGATDADHWYGVLGIRERLHAVGGGAVVRWPESGGTVVDIVIPASPIRRVQATG
jgi:two-component system sensor kinase